MKLHINGRFLSQNTTGTQRYSRELLLELSKIANLEIYLHIPKGTLVPAEFKHLKNVRSFLGGVLFDQVHMVFRSRGATVLSMSGPISILKRNQIAVMHDIGFVHFPNNFKFLFRSWYRFMYWVATKNTRSLVSVSRFSANEIERHYGLPPQSVNVVAASGSHAKKWNPVKPEVEGLNGPFYFMLGTLASRKNVLPTLSYLSSRHHAIVVCGSVGPKNIFKDAKSSNSQAMRDPGGVFVIPSAVDDEIAWLFENCEAFVFPSLYEGFGIPPLEALARGARVISSNRASLQEVLGDFATFFNPEDFESLSLALQADSTVKAEPVDMGWTQNTWQDSAQEMLRVASYHQRRPL